MHSGKCIDSCIYLKMIRKLKKTAYVWLWVLNGWLNTNDYLCIGRDFKLRNNYYKNERNNNIIKLKWSTLRNPLAYRYWGGLGGIKLMILLIKSNGAEKNNYIQMKILIPKKCQFFFIVTPNTDTLEFW